MAGSSELWIPGRHRPCSETRFETRKHGTQEFIMPKKRSSTIRIEHSVGPIRASGWVGSRLAKVQTHFTYT